MSDYTTKAIADIRIRQRFRNDTPLHATVRGHSVKPAELYRSVESM